MSATVEFTYANERFLFTHSSAEDHIYKQQQARQSFYELDLLLAIQKHVTAEGVFVDGGAHIGNHSVFFNHFCSATHVLAYEPVRETHDLLCRNVVQNHAGKVLTVPHALGAEASFGLHLPPDPNNTGMTRISLDGRLGEDGRKVVLISSLDDERALWSSFLPIVLLKLDVEGFELEALAGAKRVIELDRPWLALEAQTDEAFRAQAALLEPFHYEVQGRYCATPTYLWRPL